jgi:predicted nucleic-acid-binding protein
VTKIGIDTNVLLRLLIDDNPEQRKAVLAFGEGLGRNYTGYVTVISLVELDWALRKHYRYTKQQSVDAIRRICRIRGVEFHSLDAIERTLTAVENGGGDFADALIAQLCLDAGCVHVVSLDRKAASRNPVVELIS